MKLLIAWLISSVAVWVASKVLAGVKIQTFWDGMVVAAIFSILNWLLGWLLFVVIGIATLGLGFIFSFLTQLVCAAIVLKLTDALTERITIRGFWWAFAAAFIISLVTSLGNHLLDQAPPSVSHFVN
ncbi:MAG: phage holin family protein [Myxococcota bacterium]|jgi:putative membrane protein|nr:phage holin family protein [Myxococcota bacterium]